jgi:hypothetical protein
MNKFKFIAAEELTNRKKRSKPLPTKASSDGKSTDVDNSAWFAAARAALLSLVASSAIVVISIVLARLL